MWVKGVWEFLQLFYKFEIMLKYKTIEISREKTQKLKEWRNLLNEI